MMKLLSVFTVLFISCAAFAQNDYLFKTIESDTTATELPTIDKIWIEGLHIDAGVGIHGGVYLVEGSTRDYATGLAIKTDVGYYFNDHWAWEASSMIKFARVDELRIWGTQLTMGIRYRLPPGWYDEQVPYFRFFTGANINVVYTDGRKLPEFEEAYSRIQFEGPMAGLAFGGMRLTEQSKNMWFWEASLTAEWLTRESGIQMDKDVPVVVSRSALDGRSQLYTIFITFGGRIF
ncbi:hypothetical protein B9G69_012805 [Bdellovibrio sp. SKB1291214]|uniref:hypothetical protein n=1 Tax=Bdellovibrio sp. SKB1291214 TaxID=1732569 RepID=UPI000B51C22A|nr:hypothetical protein [Bdellovibrio sp. SKB1291214]UYL07927.1 hypothetical protein B9G69_012805 [Bdellovibrio sp. SKB1291214]